MTKTIYYKRRLTLGEFLYRVIEKSLAISVISILLLTLILMERGERKLELLEKKLMTEERIESLNQQLLERQQISVKQELFNYIDTLPIPKEEKTISIKKENVEQIALEKIVTTSNVNEIKEDSIANQNVNVIKEISTNLDLSEKVAEITPTVKTFNTSAYCPCEECCGKTDGITASGKKARQWDTIAAGSNYKIGTIIYIPELKECPNGGWFIVEDRGGAISNEKLDIYMDTHTSAKQFGRKNLECYIYEF